MRWWGRKSSKVWLYPSIGEKSRRLSFDEHHYFSRWQELGTLFYTSHHSPSGMRWWGRESSKVWLYPSIGEKSRSPHDCIRYASPISVTVISPVSEMSYYFRNTGWRATATNSALNLQNFAWGCIASCLLSLKLRQQNSPSTLHTLYRNESMARLSVIHSVVFHEHICLFGPSITQLWNVKYRKLPVSAFVLRPSSGFYKV